MAISKKELVAKVAAIADMKKSDVEKVINTTLDQIKSSVKEDEIRLLGFGTFKSVHKPAREGRNPAKPGVVVQIPAKNVVKFVAGKAFKDAINS